MLDSQKILALYIYERTSTTLKKKNYKTQFKMEGCLKDSLLTCESIQRLEFSFMRCFAYCCLNHRNSNNFLETGKELVLLKLASLQLSFVV